MATYHRLRFELLEGGEDRLTAELWSLGTLGLELPIGGLDEAVAGGALIAYFPDPLPGAVARLDPGAWRRLGAELVASDRVATADWMAAYRRRAAPFPVGGRLWIDPGEPQGVPAAAPAGRRLLRLPARQAFGTGSHASTRLAVELIETLPLAGRRVLDVGTGTGILAFAARLAGAAAVVGFDRDPVAALLAAQNRRLNRLDVALFAGPLAALRPAARFDAALVNVLPEHIVGELPEVARRLEPGGQAVFSGILVERRSAVEAALTATGLGTVAAASDGEWVALRAVRDPAARHAGATGDDARRASPTSTGCST